MMLYDLSPADLRELSRLLDARHPCVAITTDEEDYALSLVRQVAESRGSEALLWSLSRGVGGIDDVGPAPGNFTPEKAVAELLRRNEGGVTVLLDVADHLRDPAVLRLTRELIQSRRIARGCVVMIDHAAELPGPIEREATRLDLSLPSEAELGVLIRRVVQHENRDRAVQARMSAAGLKSMIRNLRGLSRRQAQRIITDVICDDRRLDDQDVAAVLGHKRRLLARDGLLEYVDSPATLDEIAGMRRLKQWLKDRAGAFDERAAELALDPPRGVLMLGVPGAGKSLCAKAVATAWGRPLLRLDPSVIYDRFVGESERRLREALRQASAMSPIVLWIDEVEKGFASAASQSSDGGLSQRMFGTLLTWMQERREPVFVFATANDIEALPPELLRKGRFDEIFFVDLPGPDVRRAVLEIHLSKRRIDPKSMPLGRLTEACEGFTGAEIEAAITAAMHGCISRGMSVSGDAVLEAMRASPPLSVTMAERIERLRAWARGRCVPAD